MSESEVVKGEPFTLAWSVPKDQRLTYKISPAVPGGPFNAQSIGEQLSALAKMLRISSNEDSDLKWMTGITAAYTYADGSIAFDLVILPKKSQLKQKQPALSTEQGEAGKP